MKNYTPQSLAELHLQQICTTLKSHGFTTNGLDEDGQMALRTLINRYADEND